MKSTHQGFLGQIDCGKAPIASVDEFGAKPM